MCTKKQEGLGNQMFLPLGHKKMEMLKISLSITKLNVLDKIMRKYILKG